MRRQIIRIIIILLLLIGIFLLPIVLRKLFLPASSKQKALEAALQQKENIIDYVIEGTRAYAFISKEGRSDYGDFFVVFEQGADKGWTRVYENDFTGLRPWKIRLADIDGDGVEEIVTAVCKVTHFDPEEKNRLFVFNYEDNKLIKKWTGSEIAGRGNWNDFIVGDLLPIPGSEVIFIEQSENGEEHLGVYYWFNFGFQLLAKSGDYKDIQSITITGENLMQITYEGKHTAELTVKDGKIIAVTPT